MLAVRVCTFDFIRDIGKVLSFFGGLCLSFFGGFDIGECIENTRYSVSVMTDIFWTGLHQIRKQIKRCMPAASSLPRARVEMVSVGRV